MNLCARLEAGIEGAIHTIMKQEKLVQADTGTKINGRLDRESGITLASLP